VASEFPYDPELLAAVQTPPQSVADVVQILDTIEATCVDGDGLKWFNWLYLQVTQAVQARVESNDFADAPWVAALDFRFAQFYFSALQSSLSGAATPGCWQAMFNVRNQVRLGRIQFAFAGMNAHINHDLALAVVATCQATGIIPQHGTTQYNDYTAVNDTLNGLTDTAKQTLHLRLLGDDLPPVSQLDDTIAAWSMSAAREAAWNNAELLWHLADAPPLQATFMDTVDGLTTVASKALLVAAP
jgi:hypothetical protein